MTIAQQSILFIHSIHSIHLLELSEKTHSPNKTQTVSSNVDHKGMQRKDNECWSLVFMKCRVPVVGRKLQVWQLNPAVNLIS